MNTPITNEQIIAMNTVLADHIVQSSVLSENDTRLEQFIAKDTPHAIIDRASAIARANDMHINIIDSYTMPEYILITTWRYDYRYISAASN